MSMKRSRSYRRARRKAAPLLDAAGAMLRSMERAAASGRRRQAAARKAPAMAAEAGETFRALAEAGADALAAARGAVQGPFPLPLGSRFESRRHVCAEGARAYRLYVPQNTLLLRPRGLVLMLHGCAQDPEDFARGTGMNALAEEHRLIVAYPAQTRTHQPAACWSWYRPGHQRRGEGEPAILAALVRGLKKEFGIARGSCFVAGLSAGASMAAVMGRNYPELFGAMGLHSGMAPGAARNLAGALRAMKRGGEAAPGRRAARARPVRAIVFQGAADDVVNPENGGHVAREAARIAGAGRARAAVETGRRGGLICTRTRRESAPGRTATEFWEVEGLGHAWSGGNPAGSYAAAAGPDASAEMVRFFLGRKGAPLGALGRIAAE